MSVAAWCVELMKKEKMMTLSRSTVLKVQMLLSTVNVGCVIYTVLLLIALGLSSKSFRPPLALSGVFICLCLPVWSMKGVEMWSISRGEGERRGRRAPLTSSCVCASVNYARAYVCPCVAMC